MPCNSDYMEASGYERNATAVYQLLDELDGRPFDPREFASGYDKRVYNKSVDLDAITRKLCAKLSTVDVSKYSLEMQVWWRDHQLADEERKATEARIAKKRALADAAMAKLTKEERMALGFEVD